MVNSVFNNVPLRCIALLQLAMREQDLQLLKQLIQINDSIRRLKRARWLQTAGRTASCGTLGVRTPSDVPSQGVGGAKERRGAVLLRQQSEPGFFAVPLRRVATLSSTSSFGESRPVSVCVWVSIDRGSV